LAHPELRGLGLIRVDGLPPLACLPTARVSLRVILPSFFHLIVAFSLRTTFKCPTFNCGSCVYQQVLPYRLLCPQHERRTIAGMHPTGMYHHDVGVGGGRYVRVDWLALVRYLARADALRQHVVVTTLFPSNPWEAFAHPSPPGIKVQVASLLPRAAAPIAHLSPRPTPLSLSLSLSPPPPLFSRDATVDEISGTRGSRMHRDQLEAMVARPRARDFPASRTRGAAPAALSILLLSFERGRRGERKRCGSADRKRGAEASRVNGRHADCRVGLDKSVRGAACAGDVSARADETQLSPGVKDRARARVF